MSIISIISSEIKFIIGFVANMIFDEIIFITSHKIIHYYFINRFIKINHAMTNYRIIKNIMYNFICGLCCYYRKYRPYYYHY